MKQMIKRSNSVLKFSILCLLAVCCYCQAWAAQLSLARQEERVSVLTDSTDLNLMSFNIRYDNPNDGLHRWDHRKEACIQMIQEQKPDIIGIQEGLHHQVQYLDDHLPGYSYAGVGRDDGEAAGEYAAIYFKKERFDSISAGTFWLSTSPEKPSVGWDAALERIVTWIQLKDKVSNRSIYTFNAHFDHKGKEARRNSAQLIVDKIQEMVTDSASLVFITGDFNGLIDQAMFTPLLESYESAQRSAKQTDTFSTFNGFSEKQRSATYIIDYIFHTKAIRALSYETIVQDYGVPYISDHYPVVARFRF